MQWKQGSDRRFSTKSCWNLVRNKGVIDNIAKQIWSTNFPKKISFFVWKLLREWVPVDICRRKGMMIVSKCQCCKDNETITHVFLHSQIVSETWLRYHNLFGIPHKLFQNPKHALTHWMQKVKGKGHICVLVHIPQSQIYARVTSMVEWLDKSGMLKHKHWSGVNSRAGLLNISLQPEAPRMPKILKWALPQSGRYKLSSHGAVKGSMGLGGGGFIVRNRDGECVYRAGIFFCHTTILETEVKALAAGIDFCVGRGIHNLDVEFDSLLIKHLLRKRKGQWKIARDMDRISEHLKSTQSNFDHIYKE